MKLFHKNKKGFTLVELLAVLLIISLISVLALTTISRESSKMKNVSNKKTYEIIKTGAKTFLYENQKLKDSIKNNGYAIITYITLRNSGYLNYEIEDLETKEDLTNLCIKINYENNKYIFEIKNPCGEWQNQDDNQSYIIEDEKLVGLQTIGNNLYYFDSDGIMQKGWQNIDNSWYYFDDTSGAALKGLQIIDNKNYYFSDDYKATRNFVQIGDKWYYFKSDYSMHYGWLQVYDRYYYFKENGEMATGLQTIDNKTYFFYTSDYYTPDEYGMMAYSEFIDGSWYGPDGSWDGITKKAIWGSDSIGWFYHFSDSSWMAVNNYYWIDGKKYKFNLDGYLDGYME